MEQQGQKMQMSEEEIIEAKNVEGIFDELYYNEDQTELLSINSIDGEDVYKVKVVKNEKTSYRYYAVESGYLMSIEEEDENKNISSTKYGDYRSVNGIMMPYFMQVNAGGQNLEFNTTEVLATGTTYGNEDINGLLVGAGVHKQNDNGMFFRLEASYTDYEDVSITGSADSDSVSNKVDADVDATAFRVSIGKAF